MSLAARSLRVSVGSRSLVSDLTTEFAPGEFVAVLGRNGSGKTLTLHTLAGLRGAAEGEVLLEGRPLRQLARAAIARRVGVLTQDSEEGFATTALESVLLGRYPHLKLLQWEGPSDRRIAHDALARVDMAELALRSTETLSGGERRRVAIAAVLAQQPQVFLLDEPTNHLDPHHQLAILGLFRALADSGRTVITTLHDPTLAARFADRVLLLHGDGRWVLGLVGTTLTAASLSELYVAPMIELGRDGRRVFVSA